MKRGLDRRAAHRFIDRLFDHRTAMLEAMVADGWPEPMARAGLRMHRVSWNVDRLADAVADELGAIGDSSHHRIVWPERVHHIWPALPGAGITPVLVGRLLGLDQRVRPSSRGTHFAAALAEMTALELVEEDEWDSAPVVVVSGSDETVRAVRDRMESTGRVVGYGHRVSLTVVDDHEGNAWLDDIATKVAKDVVMWHQQGCFSSRGVLFCGSEDRRRQFGRELAAAIGAREREWGAGDPDEQLLAERAQAMGVAQMEGEVFCEGVGYVRPVDEPFDGSREALHSVTLHPLEGPRDLDRAVAVGPASLQAAGLGGTWRRRREAWTTELGRLGVTRICPSGSLQQPPAEWWHDGRPNALGFGRVVTLE